MNGECIMAEHRMQYGYNSETGDWERCRAKPGNEGKYGCPHAEHQHMTRSDATQRNEASEERRASSEASSVPAALTKNTVDASTHVDTVDNDAAVYHERIESLLTDVVPLADKRKGRLPKFDPSEFAVKNTNRLARYMLNNFNGDRDATEAESIDNLYAGHDVERVDTDDVSSSLESIRERYGDSLTEEQEMFLDSLGNGEAFNHMTQWAVDKGIGTNSSDVHCYVDMDGCRIVMVSDGKLSKDSQFIGGYFTYTARDNPYGGYQRHKVRFDSIHFGKLLAAQGITNAYEGYSDMDDMTKRRIGQSLLGSGDYRGGKSIVLDRDYSQVSPEYMDLMTRANASNARAAMMPRMRKRGQSEPDYPVPGDEFLDSINSGNLDEKYEELKQQYPEYYHNLGSSERETIERCIADGHIASMNGGRERYQQAMMTVLNSEENGIANYEYTRRNNSGSIARVWDWKKNRDPDHDAAGRTSAFAHDFTSVEVDDSVDLDKFRGLSSEWAQYRDTLPKTPHQPSMKIRYTGKHHATGLYQPATRILAVDPRTPDSFTHEYFHHWDWSTNGMSSQSMRTEFSPIVNTYKQNIDHEQMKGTSPDRYLAPTEVLARAGELYVHWKREENNQATSAGQSLIKTDDEYATRFDYQPLLPMKQQIMDFFDKHWHDGDTQQ